MLSHTFSELIQTWETLIFLLIFSVDTGTGDRVSQSVNQLKVNDFSFTAGKSSGYLEQVSTITTLPTHRNNGVDQTHKENCLSPRKP